MSWVAYDYMTGWMSDLFDQPTAAAAAATRHNRGANAQVGGASLCRGEVYEVDEDGYLMQNGRNIRVSGRYVRVPQC